MTLLFTILATISVGLISLIGILFFLAKTDTTKLTFYFVSLASGTMLGSAFLHLIPEALERHPQNVFPVVCAGVFVFFILEKFLIWRHCHTHQHPTDAHRGPTAARMVIIGDTVHNFLDGAIIASSFLVSPTVGVSVTAAIILHEIPQELGDFGVLVHGGYSPKQAMLLNALTATSAVLGALLGYCFLEAIPVLQIYVVPAAAGGFLYIALADLIPQLHEQVDLKNTFRQIGLLACGFGVMWFLKHLQG
jgi:zinc and cadmium transporter